MQIVWQRLRQGFESIAAYGNACRLAHHSHVFVFKDHLEIETVGFMGFSGLFHQGDLITRLYVSAGLHGLPIEPNPLPFNGFFDPFAGRELLKNAIGIVYDALSWRLNRYLVGRDNAQTVWV